MKEIPFVKELMTREHHKYTLAAIVMAIAIFMTGYHWTNASPGSQYADLREEMSNEFQQVKHLIGANTSQQIIYLKIMYLQPGVNVDVAKKTAASVFKHARSMKKNPDLILSIIQVESSFRPDVPSTVGALGPMQVMPVHQKTVCHGYDLRQIDDNIKCGTQVYSMYEEQYKDMKIALTVYNRGPSFVDLALSKNQNPHNGYADKVLAVYSKLQAIGEMGSEDI